MVLLRFPGGSHLVRILKKFWSRQDQKTGERQIFSKRSQLSIDKSLIVTFYVSFEETAIFAHLAITLSSYEALMKLFVDIKLIDSNKCQEQFTADKEGKKS